MPACFVEALGALSRDLGLPQRLTEVGIESHARPDAMRQTRLLVNNPRPLNGANALAVHTAAH